MAMTTSKTPLMYGITAPPSGGGGKESTQPSAGSAHGGRSSFAMRPICRCTLRGCPGPAGNALPGEGCDEERYYCKTLRL